MKFPSYFQVYDFLAPRDHKVAIIIFSQFFFLLSLSQLLARFTRYSIGPAIEPGYKAKRMLNVACNDQRISYLFIDSIYLRLEMFREIRESLGEPF